MLAQQQIYSCLQTDHELKQQALLEHQRVKAWAETEKNLKPSMHIAAEQNQTDTPDGIDQSPVMLDPQPQTMVIDSLVQQNESHTALHLE